MRSFRSVYEEEESRIYRGKANRREVVTEANDNQSGTYESILRGIFTKEDEASAEEGDRPYSQIRLPRIRMTTPGKNRKTKVHSSLLNLSQATILSPVSLTRPSYPSKSPRLAPSSTHRRILDTYSSRNGLTLFTVQPSIHEILLSTQSKQIVIRLQKLNPLLRRLSFIAVQELVVTCRLVKFAAREIILNKRLTRNMHCYIVITGGVLLKNKKFRARLMATAGDTFEEGAAIQMNYLQHKERIDVVRCLNEETVCMRISKSEWMMVRHHLKADYGLQGDIKVFQNTLRRNYYHKMSQLGKLIYQNNK